VSARLEGELLEPQRLCSRGPTLCLAAIDELCRPAEPGGLDILRAAAQGVRGRAQPVGEALEGPEEGPRGPWGR
jgi:hypothetical protein